MSTEMLVRPVHRIICRRCGGYVLPDIDGDLVCLMCGRPAHARRPVLADEELRDRRAA